MPRGALVWVVLVAVLLVGLSAPAAVAQQDGGAERDAPEGLGALILAPVAMLGALAAFWALWLVWFVLIMAIGLGSVLASVLAIWDCAHRDFPERSALGTWCVLILLTHWIGAIIYYFGVYRPDKPPKVAAAGG